MTDNPRIKVLIAEDLRSSRLNIQNLLRHWGYEPVACEDGLAAQRALAAPDGPRVAILDWVMPGMTGPEVCKWIAEELGSFVYTILLTSKSDQGALIEGLSAGAHTYITKPARPAELQTWIRVGLRMVDYEKELARKSADLGEYARQMEALAEKLALQLAETGQCDALAGMGAGLGKEIRLSAQHILDAGETLAGSAQSQQAQDARLSNQDFQRFLADTRYGLRRILTLAEQLENFNRQRKAPAEPRCEANDVVKAAVDLCEASLGSVKTVEFSLAQDLPQVRVVPEVFQRAIVQFLLASSVNAPDSIHISTALGEDAVAVLLISSGPVGPELLQSAGLAADIDLLEKMGGKCRLEVLPEDGARLSMTLPVAADS